MGVERSVRVLLVGRHFWPHGSIDSAGHLIELASGLQLAGLRVAVLTPKYSANWSDQLRFREIDVHRPLRIFRSGWTVRSDRTASRYIRGLRDWIEHNAGRFDLVFCHGAREEAVAAVAAAKSSELPSVVRVAGHGRCSDLEYFANGRAGKRCRAAAADADAVVLSDSVSQRRWVADFGSIDSTHRIPIGIPPSIDRERSERGKLRKSLSRINGDLLVPDSNSVILSTERLTADSGVQVLAESAYSLSEKINGLYYWFIGDGPERDSVFSRLKSDGLRQSMAMPGSFGLMKDVFLTADLMIHAGDEGFESHVPSAIASALPIVIANTAVARQFFEISESDVNDLIERKGDDARDDGRQPGRCVWWFDSSRPGTLRRAVEQVVRNHEAALVRSRNGRKLMQIQRPQTDSIQRYLRLFQSLVRAEQSDQPGSESMEEIH